MQIFCLFCKKKHIFFYFTHPLLQKTHISLSILHIYSIKYSFFLYFLLFPSIWNKLTNSSSLSSHTHTHPSTKSPTPNQPPSSPSSYKPNTNPKSPTPSHHQRSNRTNPSESPAFTELRPWIVGSWSAEKAGRFLVIGDERG